MNKLIKKFKAWLACLVRANEVFVVYTSKSHNVKLKRGTDADFSIIIVTYQIEDAIEMMDTYNKYNRQKGEAWLTKHIVY